PVRIQPVRDGRRAAAIDDLVAVEAPLELRLDGRPLTVVMRTPGEDEELARGFLFTEGLIVALDDVQSMTRPARLSGDEVGNVLDLRLRPRAERPRLERVFYASSSCGVCGKSSIASLAMRAPAVTSSLALPLAVA